MKRILIVAAAIILILGVFSFLLTKISVSSPEEMVPAKVESANITKSGAAAASSSEQSSQLPAGNLNHAVNRKPYDTGIRNDQRVQSREDGKRLAIEGIEISKQLHSPDISAEEDLDYIEQIFGLYRLSFQYNPVAGDNQMIMDALLGNNPGDLVVFSPDHPSLDGTGQLLDRWGTPYFFHALSGTEMEIFSAGPDREFNTADDVQKTNRDDNPLTGAELETDVNEEG